MSGPTTIEWADYTLNPGIYGCQEVSAACSNCYAAKMAHRQVAMHNYPSGITEKRASGVHWTGKVLTDIDAMGPAFAALPKKRTGRVFVTSMADVFHPDVPGAFIHSLFLEMRARPHLTFLLLTKRPERMADAWLAHEYEYDEPAWPSNVWAGTTVESQEHAGRIYHLTRIPGITRFVSCEPLLGPLDLRQWLTPHVRNSGLHWVIGGGESGQRARPTELVWIRTLRDQCTEAGVPFLFKQWGEYAPMSHALARRVGRRAAGRHLDGRTWDEVPIERGSTSRTTDYARER